MIRTRLVWPALVVTLLGLASPAAAHRLDEYLHATRVSVDSDRVVLEIDLTPGANIAGRLSALIDADGDERISSDEEATYARDVIRSLRLSIDDRVVPLGLMAWHFPTHDEMAAGIGTIRLRAEARMQQGIGRHRLVYVNSNTAEGSVFLVNALVPGDPRLVLGSPQRDVLQRGLAFDYDVAPPPTWTRIGWLFGATALFGVLIVVRRDNGR